MTSEQWTFYSNVEACQRKAKSAKQHLGRFALQLQAFVSYGAEVSLIDDQFSRAVVPISWLGALVPYTGLSFLAHQNTVVAKPVSSSIAAVFTRIRCREVSHWWPSMKGLLTIRPLLRA